MLCNNANTSRLLAADPLLKCAFSFDRFTQSVILNRGVRLPVSGHEWTLGEPWLLGMHRLSGDDYVAIQRYLTATYPQYTSYPMDVVRNTVVGDSHYTEFHSVQRYLIDCYKRHGASMGQPDAVSLVFNFLQTHLGAGKELPALTRAKSRVLLMSAVARMLPGRFTGYGVSYARSDLEGQFRSFGPGCRISQFVALKGKGLLDPSVALTALMPDAHLHSMLLPSFKTVPSIDRLAWITELSKLDSTQTTLPKIRNCNLFIQRRSEPGQHAYLPHGGLDQRHSTIVATLRNDLPRGNQFIKPHQYLTVQCGIGWDDSRRVNFEAIAAERDKVWGAAVKLYAFPDAGYSPEIWWIDSDETPELMKLAMEQGSR